MAKMPRFRLRRNLEGLDWIVAAMLGVAYIVACVRVGALSYGDYPDHLARAVVIGDLLFHGGRHFGTVFQFHMIPVPYLLGDLLLVATVEMFGADGATIVWTTVSLLVLPLAVWCYLHAARAALHTRALFVIVSLYLSTDWFFLASFLNFRLAIAMVIFTLALVQSLRRWWSPALFVGYAITVALGYLMHLAFIVFLAAAIGATALWRLWTRTTTVRREIALFVPVLLALGWQGVSAKLFPEATEVAVGHVDWGSLSWKLRRLDWDFVRLSAPIDWLIALGFVSCTIVAIGRRVKLQALAKPAISEMLVLTATFFALYFALPMRHGDVTYIDVRALALATAFTLFALLLLFDAGVGERERVHGFLCAALVFFAVGNLVYLNERLTHYHAWLVNYRTLTKPISAGESVLPVYTRAIEGRWRPFIHAAPLATVVDRGAIIPNMFSGDRGQPMKYFRYIHRAYSPVDSWYTSSSPATIDWNAIACNYDFVLVTQPFEPQRIGVHTTVAAQNSSGALLKVDRRQCHSLGDSQP
jgi:hypothetical protein